MTHYSVHRECTGEMINDSLICVQGLDRRNAVCPEHKNEKVKSD